MTSGQDVSEFLDTSGLVKSYFSSFLRKKIKKNREIFFWWCSDASEDQEIGLFGGFLANPDMPLSLYECRCDERSKLKLRVLTSCDTGFCGGLEHLKIETR
jgi:hypothetical protein